jgi:cyclase
LFRPRVIPVILVDGQGHAVKSIRFKNFVELGDSINTVSLFNAFKVDELVILDIAATRQGRSFSDRLMRDLASEAQIPLSVGGGVMAIEDIRRLIVAGAEKVVLSSVALSCPEFVRQASEEFGSSSITVCLDCRRDWLGRDRLVSRLPKSETSNLSPVEAAQLMEANGAGEIIVQSVAYDGMMQGYDLALTTRVADCVGIPVVALGGAGRFEHLVEAGRSTNASAFASGSLFCFQDQNRGVLISYPSSETLAALVRA